MYSILDLLAEKYELFLFVYIRMLGFIIFNPIFGRRNIPGITKSAIAMVFAFATVTAMDVSQMPVIDNIFMFMILLMKEFVYGYAIGLVANIFYSVLSISGEVMDMQMGFGMSTMYDPGSNIQMPLMGSFLNVAYILVFFLTECHLALIKIISLSYNILPIAQYYPNADVGLYLAELFGYIMILSIRLAFPVLAAELITETGIGIIMRAVPQINVFVVGVQLKVIIALVVMLIISPVTVVFLDRLMEYMQTYIVNTMIVIAGE